MAQCQRDYANALLGVKHSSFRRWVKVGRLLRGNPTLREHLIAGRITLSQIEESIAGRAQRAASTEATSHENSEANGFTTLSITAPVPAILYMEDSLSLARGLVGVSDGDEEAVSALLAEAWTESSEPVDLGTARRRFRVRERRIPRPAARAAVASAEADLARRESVLGVDPFAPLSLPAMGVEAQRRAAHRAHCILSRLIRRRDRLAARQEDLLLDWALDGVHERRGFRNFERFARDILDLSASACNARLRRARLRARNHPAARARAEGRITAVQTELLEQMQRSCHVPPSDLGAWIEYAAAHTVRRLRAAIGWAHRQWNLDYRRWSLSHCETPDDDQLLTTARSMESLVRRPGGDELVDALLTWDTAPRGTLRLRISRAMRDQILVAMASMQDEVRYGHGAAAPRRIPPWFALCRIFHRARSTWRVHHQMPPAAQRRILDRDGYRCAAPECTQRRNLQIHHLRYRSRGGDDGDGNRITLCAFHHHQGEHGGLMKVRGEIGGDGRGLVWEMGLDGLGRAVRVYRDEKVLV
jgi:hypothetical protein